jgi:phenazine biosynthesis protein phzE
MARLAHTEYFIEGRTDRDVRDILRETMFAPTVTGSPLESACKVIARHEPQGRGYYSGVLALISRDEHGQRAMDSAIAIRTAEIDGDGRMRIGVGATLVRDSDPAAEAAETRAKAAGLLAALSESDGAALARHPEVLAALGRRNEGISRYWFHGPAERGGRPEPRLVGRRALVVDNEDTFTSMIALQLRSLGLEVTVRRFDEPYRDDDYALLVMGPGPGDPRDAGHPKIAHVERAIARRLERQLPLFAVCLSHQVLCHSLGLELVRRPRPNQGVQRAIDLFGEEVHVGFYNTFAARSEHDKIDDPLRGVVEVSRDPVSGEVHGLRGEGFASVQFHPESVLTRDGVGIVGGLLTDVLRPPIGALGGR